MSGRVRYQARAFGVDPLGDSVWVGLFPDGPIVKMNGVSFALLDVVEAAGRPLTVEEVMETLRETVSDVPDNAEPVVHAALEDFVQRGFMVHVRDGA